MEAKLEIFSENYLKSRKDINDSIIAKSAIRAAYRSCYKEISVGLDLSTNDENLANMLDSICSCNTEKFFGKFSKDDFESFFTDSMNMLAKNDYQTKKIFEKKYGNTPYKNLEECAKNAFGNRLQDSYTVENKNYNVKFKDLKKDLEKSIYSTCYNVNNGSYAYCSCITDWFIE
jgi:hypothetical protein